MQQEMTPTSGPLAGTTVKFPIRIITYAWGERYVETLLTLTLPALLAPGNLPYVASEVPCELVILTERRFFPKFNRHPAIVRVRNICPVRFMRLDDLIVSKDKYGMTLTYALHRAFSDLGPAMTEHWQIFLNADFILASGSLRSVIRHLSRGARIVASPSYCTIAEEVIPELRRHLDTTTSILSVPPRELARLVLQHRHRVIQGKTVNQLSFHMRYADQFYWSVGESTLVGYQMPVSIVGLRPERYVAEPNSYWDFGLMWEYCPRAEICVIGDSDDFVMLELRDKGVAEDQVVPGPPNKQEIAERMVTWVTPYQRHFLKFPLTLHDRDLPPTVEDARARLRSFVDEVMSHAPPLPSHIKHSQWEYHWANFQDARRLSSRLRSWGKTRLQHVATAATSIARVIQQIFWKALGLALQHVATTVISVAHVIQRIFWKASGSALGLKPRTIDLRAKQKAIEMSKVFARVVGDRHVRPALRRLGLEIVKSRTLLAIQKTAKEATLKAEENERLRAEHVFYAKHVAELEQHNRLLVESATQREFKLQEKEGELTRARIDIATLSPENERLRAEHAFYAKRVAELEQHNRLLSESATTAVRKLQDIRQTDYQILMAQQHLLAGMKDADPRFHELYEKCRPYTMTSIERLYALYKSVEYIAAANLPGDFVEAGVWRGGSCMLIAETLLALDASSRRIFLFDTFAGHPQPDAEKDIDIWGNRAIDEWQRTRTKEDDNHGQWAQASLEEVRANLALTGYPADALVFVKGMVEETMQDVDARHRFALLRLDTDWYESTRAGLEYLYPRLVSGGVLILDDYGHYKGQQLAVDEYFAARKEPILLNRIDYSCRLGVKR
jgi:Macrocin-O-methyltransferase (TylF)